MAKKATITPVTDTVNNATAINTQLTAINDKLDNTLSLDGSTPNAMNADLDLNSNDILNAGNIYAGDIVVAGNSVAASAAASAASAAASAASADGAQAAQTAAEAALDSFDDIYLGPKASEPTLDNDGDALVAGSLYYNTTLDKLYIYSGSVWQVTAGAAAGDLQGVNNLSDLTNFVTARANLGLAIGTDVQAYSTTLANTTASFTTADETKLDGIEALADVTDTANVTAAGALMDSELTSIASVKALNQGVATTDSPTFNVVTAGDMNITGPTPLLTLTDTDVADEYTVLLNSGGTTYLRSRNGVSDGAITFQGFGGGVVTEYGRFNSAGNFGLGTTSPSAAIDVVGNAEINGNITVTGTVDGRDIAADGVTLDDLDAQYDPTKVIYKVAPVVPERVGNPSWFPSGGAPYLNTIISADGPGASDTIWRSVLIGDSIASEVAAMSQAVAVGNGAMRFSGTSDATTAIGSLSMQWLGLTLAGGEDNSDAMVRTRHDFVTANRLDDVAWDAFGLETALPGTRTKLDAVVIPTVASSLEGNTAVGRNSGLHIVKGYDNTLMGRNALAHGFDSTENVAIGNRALRDGALANQNVAVGTAAGQSMIEGSDNIFIGDHAGFNATSGSNNLMIGSWAGDGFTGSVSNNLFIGMGTGAIPLVSGDFATGRLGVNTASPSATLHVNGSTYFGNPPDGLPSNNASGDGAVMSSSGKLSMLGDSDWSLGIGRHTTEGKVAYFYYGGSVVGNIAVTASATAYNTSSDYRLKEDWQPMVGASDRVMALNPVNFAWKSNGSRVDGFLAHEVQSVAPEVVTGEKDAVDADGVPEMQAIDQSKLVPLLTAALQEALSKIETMEARLAALETV